VSGEEMPNCRSLLEAAERNPAGLRFSELCQLAECFDWELARQKGSHRVYKRRGTIQIMNFQDFGGNAKEYQVKQLLTAIEELGLELK
jgi:hypothetical protein